MREVLEEFCLASGLKVNIQKSKFIASNNVSNANCSKFANIIGYHHTNNIEKYLGFPLLTRRVKKIFLIK